MKTEEPYIKKTFKLTKKEYTCFLSGLWIGAIFIFLLMLLIPTSSSAQNQTTFLTEVGTTDFKSQSYAGMIGFTNFQDDSFHAGPLYKNYGSAHRVGVRININLNLNKAMFVFVQGDVFANTGKQDNSSFLENSAGLGLILIEGLSLNLGYQMEVYNPVTKERREDQPNVKVGYKFGRR